MRYASSRNSACVVIGRASYRWGEAASVAPRGARAQTQIAPRAGGGVPVDQPGRLRIQSAVS
ncbi:hypothetical protein CFB47_13365 [Burkholderia sp. AU27893]|uniref:Uncharacterized protein n=1 Tax=Burkholderia contaminans TaxID=488447 RepID=A0A2S5DUF2_9BURK|nr:hypothetical protein CFB47_13365 [Burkholderia sp. AU27893]OXJ00974.1 hypothetical protein CFB48_12980 [Burkholderia sp. AU33647]POZ82729.1 hypothetical protein C3743_21300 [Burkholderia contaminans]